MIDLLPVLIKATTTIQKMMSEWFAGYPADRSWTIVSDYCVGDDNKKNDVFSFVVLANFEKTENIGEYISKVAPKDIKKVRQVPLGLIQFLTCPLPITFSLSFVIDRKSALLRDYLGVEQMKSFIPDACEFVEILQKNSPASDSLNPMYFDEVLERLRIFEKDLSKKVINAKLTRQIHLASGFAAVLFYLVANSTQAGTLRWISDRDKLIDHNDTVVYDLAYLYCVLMLSSQPGLKPNAEGKFILDLPKIFFELPDQTGKHRYDALIRLPDYIAGTLADIDQDMSFTLDKFKELLDGVLVDSKNNCVVQLTSVDKKITARYVEYRS